MKIGYDTLSRKLNHSSLGHWGHLTPKDEELIGSLVRLEMLRAPRSSKDSDQYSYPQDFGQVSGMLRDGQGLVITHPQIGTRYDDRVPRKNGTGFDGPVSKLRQQFFQKQSLGEAKLQGTFVADIEELKRCVQANGFDSKLSVLTPEESQVSRVLQKYQGTITGQFETFVGNGWNGQIHWFVSKSDPTEKNDGLYNPRIKKGGFLGFGGNLDRLTPYEAMNLLARQEPIKIVRNGTQTEVSSFGELRSFDQIA